MRGIALLLCLLAAGCSGGPLKEMPVFEPPPTGAPDPEERPCAPPAAVAAKPELPQLVGAWRSVAVTGPGSASVERIVLVFDADGGVVGAAFQASGPTALAGTYLDMDGAVQVDLGEGDVRLWAKELAPGSLVLREGDKEIRLELLR